MQAPIFMTFKSKREDPTSMVNCNPGEKRCLQELIELPSQYLEDLYFELVDDEFTNS